MSRFFARKLSTCEATMAILVTVSMTLCLVQTLRYEDARTHHEFALKSNAELTLMNQQCEAIREQCCQ